MRQIVWSKPAQVDYWSNIDFLIDKWTETEALNFIFKTDTILEVISENPKAFKKFNYKRNIHVVPVTKEINLFYMVRKDTIELLRFWNNYQNPQKLNLKKI